MEKILFKKILYDCLSFFLISLISASIVVCDCIFDAWQRATEADLRTPATDPVRQNIFITVALDALLTHHPDTTLRDKTVAAYQRRLERLGIVAPRPMGGDDEA